MATATTTSVLIGAAAFFALLALAIALIYGTYHAVRSPVGPLSLVRHAWEMPFLYARTDVKTVLLIA